MLSSQTPEIYTILSNILRAARSHGLNPILGVLILEKKLVKNPVRPSPCALDILISFY
jgi:hypothetical protein